MSKKNEVYLGDGLYARMDEYGMLVLRAPREAGDHWVGLEPEVWTNLLEFMGTPPMSVSTPSPVDSEPPK